MKRRRNGVFCACLRLAAACWASGATIFGQSTPAANGTALGATMANPGTADADWASVTGLLKPPPQATPPTTMPAFIAQQVAAAQKLQGAATNFVTSHGSDIRAGAARKIGIMAAIQAYAVGGSAYQAAAQSLAAPYRQDATVSAADRFDVALAFNSVGIPLKPGERLIDNGAAYKGLADSLHAEFGDQPPVYHFYRQVMLTADNATSVAVANEVLGLNAPDWAKAAAQAILNRNALIGKPLKQYLIQYGGQPLDLMATAAKPTLIYYWTNQMGTAQVSELAQYARSIPKNTRVIYVCIMADMKAVAAGEAAAPLPGKFCFQASGMGTAEETGLGVLQLPYVYALDPHGNLVGYGRPEDIPNLMSLATK